MTEYSFNHVIPRFQQLFFIDENGCVQSRDILNRKYQSTNSGSINISPDISAGINDYWKKQGQNPKKMEDYLNSFEFPCSKLFQSIVDGKSDLDDYDQKMIVDWIQSRKIFNKHFVEVLHLQAKKMVDFFEMQVFDRLIKMGVHEYWFWSVFDQSLEGMKDFITSQFDPYQIIMKTTSYHNIRMHLRKPIWKVIRLKSDEDRFITSDETIVEIKNRTIGSDNYFDYFIPISPKIIIFISDFNEIPEMNNVLINKINSYLKNMAQHFYIHNKNYRP